MKQLTIIGNHYFQLIILLSALCILTQGERIFFEPRVKVLGVSIFMGKTSSNWQYRSGSLNGGTVIYVNVVGHSLNADDNQIFVGPYPCTIPLKGVNDIYIQCTTTAATNPNRLMGLEVKVRVAGRPDSNCDVGMEFCLFNYVDGSTPLIHSLFSRAGNPGTNVTWFGNFKMSSTKFITAMKIGDQICDRFNQGGLNDDDDLSYWADQLIQCTLSPQMEGGFYDVSFVNNLGIASKMTGVNLAHPLRNQQEYSFQIVPEIKQISGNTGSENGAILKIEGNGFSVDAKKVKVSVGGLSCPVITTDLNSITCQLEKGATTNSAQKVSGSGLRYRRYKTQNTLGQDMWWPQTVKDNIDAGQADPYAYESGDDDNTQINQNQWIIAEPDIVDDEQRTYIAHVIDGYFKAPQAGDYIFYVNADDRCALWISDNDSQTVTKISAYRDNWINMRNVFNEALDTSSVKVTLAQDEVRYILGIGMNFGGPGYFTISSLIKNSDTSFFYSNSAYIVQKLSVKYNPVFWNFKVTVKNYQGKFNLYFSKRVGTTTTIDASTVNMTFDASCTTLNNTLYYQVINTPTLCERTSVLADDGTTIIGYTWDIKFLYRPGDDIRVLPKVRGIDAGFTSSVNSLVELVTDPSSGISGSYQILYDGTAIKSNNLQDLPYNITPDLIAAALGTASGYQQVQVTKSNKPYVDGVQLFLIVKAASDFQAITFDTTNLLGADSATSVDAPIFEETVISERSNDLFYISIPNAYLSAPSDADSYVQVTVGDSQSSCSMTANCAYKTDDTKKAILQTASYDATSKKISFSLELPAGSTVAATDFTAYFGGFLLPVSITDVAASPIVGEVALPTFSIKDINAVQQEYYGNLKIPGGTYTFLLSVNGFGLADTTTNSIADIIITPKIVSLSETTGGDLGGTQLTIKGSSFTSDSAATLAVAFDTNEATIIERNINYLVIRTPQVTISSGTTLNLKAQVTVAGVEATSTDNFTFDSSKTCTITSISPVSASPVLKGMITITGTNFGTTLADISVYMTQEGNDVYRLPIKSVTDTQIKAILIGGTTGAFQVVVRRTGHSESSSADFNYVIKVIDINPKVGSKAGGTILTIKGENFSPELLDNNILIGDGTGLYNQFCDLISIQKNDPDNDNQDILKCTTPAYSLFEGYSGDIKILVQGQLLETATCDAAVCAYVYNDDKTPTISALAKSGTAGVFLSAETVTLTGTLFQSGAVTVYFGADQIDSSLVQVNSDTQIVITTPALSLGKKNLIVYVEAFGNALHTLEQLNFVLFTNGATPSTILKAGADITISGGGLDPLQTPVVNINTNADGTGFIGQCSLESWTVDSIQCRVPDLGSRTVVYYSVHDDINQPVDLRFNSIGAWQKLTVKTSTNTINAKSLGQFNTPDSFTFTLTTGTVSITDQAFTAYFLKQSATNDQLRYKAQTISLSGSTFTVAFQNVPAGNYTMYVSIAENGFFTWSSAAVNTFIVKYPDSLAVSADKTTSFAGGKEITITSNGLSDQTQVYVCGLKSVVTTSSFSSLTFVVPQLNSKEVSDAFQVIKQVQRVSHLPETNLFASLANNLMVNDYNFDSYYSDSVDNCFIAYDFGEKFKVAVNKVQFFTRVKGLNAALNFSGSVIQGTNDISVATPVWTTLLTVDNSVHLGQNMIKDSAKQFLEPFRYIRFLSNQNVVVRRSNCQLTELEIYGVRFFSDTVDPTKTKACDITLQSNSYTTSTAVAQVTYDASQTFNAVLDETSPRHGPVAGGTDVIFKVTGAASTAVYTVTIDGIDCVQKGNDADQITCTTGARQEFTEPSIQIKIDGNLAFLDPNVEFFYASYWSASDTWGGEFEPAEGDSLYVPPGQVLMVDQSTNGVLKALIVEGILMFADNQDITFDARYIIVRHGRFIAGTESNRYQNKLTITLYGNQFDPQLPDAGNKCILCHQCRLDIHGQLRDKTWSELGATVDVNAQSITLVDPVDWQVGEELVIASTDFDHTHAQQRVIKEITLENGGTTITFDQPLKYRHYSAIEQYDSAVGDVKDFTMRAEVGLLTRNIKIQGDQTSTISRYGAHLMIHGKTDDQMHPLRGRISYAEFTNVGQPSIIGRYPIHFHMNGDVSDSFVIGNAVHHSFARVTTIHAVSFLRVQKNVGYHCAGHNIFFEDGIETHNVVEDNLIISTYQSWSMLQTDITAASFWVTNPLNHLRRNRAAGGDFYGFWYEIQEHPDGPSATSDICPQGFPLGAFEFNKAHSYLNFGLRIFVLTNRERPCDPTKDQKLPNPFSSNPSTQIVWSDFEAWKNKEDGVICQECGNQLFQRFQVADSYQSGFNAHVANYTAEKIIIKDWIIIGLSQGNSDDEKANEFHKDSRAIIMPRTDGFLADSIAIHNFADYMRPFETCSQCISIKQWNQGGKESHFSNIQYFKVDSTVMLYWQLNRKELIYDLDGTLTGTTKPTYLTPIYPHLKGMDGCIYDEATVAQWDDAVLCTGVKLRQVEFFAPMPLEQLRGIQLKVLRLTSTKTLANAVDDDFTNSYSVRIKNKPNKDAENGFVAVLATGQSYNLHFKEGIDFTHLLMATSDQWQPYTVSNNDKPIIIQFNYTNDRELYDIGFSIGGMIDVTQFVPKTNLDSTSCNFGDYTHDTTKKQINFCVSGNGRKNTYDKVDIQGVICRFQCPAPPVTNCANKINKYWFNAADWLVDVVDQNGVKQSVSQYQTNGDIVNVTIPCDWNMIINQDPALPAGKVNITAHNITVIGKLSFDTVALQDITLNTKSLNIHGGEVQLGAKDNQYTGKFKLQLLGMRNDAPLYMIDEFVEVGNQVISVIGSLRLFGASPSTTWTRLAANVQGGETQISVISAAGWSVGDEIVIAPSGRNASQYDRRTITKVTSNADGSAVVELNSTLDYFHYGSKDITVSKALDESITQTIDLRAIVAHITRGIVIAGSGEDNWGGRILVYWFNQQDVSLRGLVELDGIEFQNMGQRDTSQAGLDFRTVERDGTSEQPRSYLINSALHDCIGLCFKSEFSKGWEVVNNVFFKAHPIHMDVKTSTEFQIKGNAFISALQRNYNFAASHLFDVKAFIYNPSTFKVATDNIIVTQNSGQGSDGPGFVFPSLNCKDQAETIQNKKGFYDNQAMGCLVGVLWQEDKVADCNWSGRVSVAWSGKGFMVSPTCLSIEIQYVIATENDIGISLRFSHEGVDNSGFFRNSYVSAVSRLDCPDCFNQAQNSQNFCQGFGVQMQVVTQGGEDFPLKSDPLTGFDVICNSEVYDSRCYVSNVVFENFKKSYSSLPNCGNTHVWTTHPSASDATSGHYLVDTKCVNCDHEAQFFFRDPSPSWLGWLGGCGEMLCTAPDNVLLTDWTGSFLREKDSDPLGPRQAISHNEVLGDNLPFCKLMKDWNGGFSCSGDNMAVLEWESTAADKQTRMHAPVYVTDEQTPVLRNRINAFREWEWSGRVPLNKRRNTFIGLVQLNQVYNITYNGLNPSKIIHRIQYRTSDPALEDTEQLQYVILKVFYQESLSLKVTNLGVGAAPNPNVFIQGQDPSIYDLSKQIKCGAHNYFSQNNTIHFVLTASKDCILEVKQTNAVFITVNIAMSVEDFFNSDAKVTFVNQICAFLGISTSRLRIVGAKTGRRYLQSGSQTAGSGGSSLIFLIDEQDSSNTPTNTGTSTQPPMTQAQSLAQLTQLVQKLETAISSGSLDTGVKITSLVYEIKMIQSTLEQNPIVDNTTLTTSDDRAIEFSYRQQQTTMANYNEDSSDNSSYTVIAVLLVVLFIVLVFIGYVLFSKYRSSNQVIPDVKVIDRIDSEDNQRENIPREDIIPSDERVL